ncbi:hypothetical protein N7476_010705 [Penicillium atrosanguineum]|uniref:Uncharacterized protein n=1 Tax=Penicillium atrosanguineum TaxID=1132637 RepID=A0A9W9TZB8_9EURO|nr:hypothetical protein N7476_010705 [Penicillium atrosanguineum]
MFADLVDLMARRFLHGQNLTLGLSVFLFTFMFLPTFLVLLAVVAFFLLAYPWLRKSGFAQRIDAA